MRKFRILLVALVLVSVLVGCSNAQKAKNSELESSAIASFSENKTTNQTNSEIVSQNVVVSSTTEKQISTTEIATKEKTTKIEPETTESTTKKQTTTTNSTTTKKEQTSKKPTTTTSHSTTQKPSTTHKTTTTKPSTTKATTTTKKSGLSKSDIDWVQSQANSYIKSLGCNLDPNVRSFSGRIASKSFSDRNALLSTVKETIYEDYKDCINSGWETVDMYCKIEPADKGYYIYVVFG